MTLAFFLFYFFPQEVIYTCVQKIIFICILYFSQSKEKILKLFLFIL